MKEKSKRENKAMPTLQQRRKARIDMRSSPELIALIDLQLATFSSLSLNDFCEV